MRRVQQLGLGLVGAIVFIGALVVGATVWLYLTEPVTVVNAVNEGNVSPFLEELARVLLDALRGLLRYL
jgi:hypothetical protein